MPNANKYCYSYADNPNENGDYSCVVRMKNRRITMWKHTDNSYTIKFERPILPDDEPDGIHRIKNGRVIMSYIKLSEEALAVVAAMWFGFQENHPVLPFIRQISETK